MFLKHLLRIVDLDCTVGLFGEAPDNEVAHSEEKLFVAAHLFVLLAPLGQDRFEPKALRQRVTTHERLVDCTLRDLCLIVRASDL